MKNLILPIILMALVMVGCGRPSIDESLQQAESELALGNIDEVASYCRMISDTPADELSSTQMCRLAILYARMSELSENHDYMVTATELYDRAVTADSVALEAYVDSLDIECQSVVNSIRDVAGALSTPCDMTRLAEEDDCDAE